MAVPTAAAAEPRVLTRAAEHSVLRFARVLYGADAAPRRWSAPGPALRIGEGLAGAGGDRPLLHALVPVIIRGTWHWLTHSGGYRERDVVVRGRLTRARLWDTAEFAERGLALSGATPTLLALWHDATLVSAPPSEAAAEWPAPATDGDRLALSAAALALLTRVDEPLAGTLRAWGERHLPLMAVLRPSAESADDPLPLPGPAESVALQFLDDTAARAWLELALPTRVRRAADQSAGQGAVAGIVRRLLLLGSDSERVVCVAPVARFVARIGALEGGPSALESMLERIAGERAARAEREALLHGFGTMLRTALALEETVAAIRLVPWADRTEGQKRVAAEFESSARPHTETLRQLSRRLRRELG